ncbi:MAG: rRNA pseudouridine synthase [Clostridia bacterium]|nr:rRNA pseudouridine synthase [Clostridia bacterium]
MRINKYIAASGIASRRAADELISSGRVKVNNKVVTALGTEIDEYNDTVVVDGKKIEPIKKTVYIMFHKPKGCVCTLKDNKGRKTVMDYLGEFTDTRLFPVGRLDYDTEGLLLLTNDGDFANRLTHPSGDVPKTYIVKVNGPSPESDIAKLRNGIVLDGEKLRRCKIKLLGEEEGGFFRYEVTIFEGKNRQIRRMFESIGREVTFLKRVKIGDCKLGGLGRGAYRYLTDKELSALNRL